MVRSNIDHEITTLEINRCIFSPGGESMKARAHGAVAALLFPAVALAQNPKAATYITAEQVKAINALPGVDRQIVNVDVGNTNLAVGVIHRGATGAPPAAGAGAGAGAAAAAGAAAGAMRRKGHAAGRITDRVSGTRDRPKPTSSFPDRARS